MTKKHPEQDLLETLKAFHQMRIAATNPAEPMTSDEAWSGLGKGHLRNFTAGKRQVDTTKRGRKPDVTAAERDLVRSLHRKIMTRDLAWKDIGGIVSERLGTKERSVGAYREMVYQRKKRGKLPK